MAIATVTATAQKHRATDERKTQFGFGGIIGLPTGAISGASSFAYGGDVQVEFPTAPTLGLTVSVGYVGFAAKSGYTIIGGLVPVLAGAKIYMSPKFHGDALLGVSFVTGGGGGSAFTFGIGAGYKVSDIVDIGVKYQAVTGSRTGFFGARVGVAF